MDRREPSGVRNVSHSYPISRNTIVRADGEDWTFAAPRLDSLRYRPRRVPSQAHVGGGTRGGLRVDLQPAFLPRLDLAAPAGGLAGGLALFGDVVSVQALQPDLASAHQEPLGA